MIKYFCDICGKDITDEIRYNTTFIYETKVGKGYRKMTHKRDLCLCEKCNETIVKNIKEVK